MDSIVSWFGVLQIVCDFSYVNLIVKLNHMISVHMQVENMLTAGNLVLKRDCYSVGLDCVKPVTVCQKTPCIQMVRQLRD